MRFAQVKGKSEFNTADNGTKVSKNRSTPKQLKTLECDDAKNDHRWVLREVL